ncbi:adenylate kinase 2 [Scenedesmus sp. PABB004]|nr:adenylate kinase 2 [Scenedesmus sp. PABB004]
MGTPAGKKAKDFMDRGVLVPDEVVVEMVKSRLSTPDVASAGWLLDGYPRSASQAEAIEREGIRPDIFLLIDVPSELLVERVVGRRMDPETGAIYHLKYKPPPKEVEHRLVQRSDDTEEKCKTRLETHFKNVDAVIGYYTNCLHEVTAAARPTPRRDPGRRWLGGRRRRAAHAPPPAPAPPPQIDGNSSMEAVFSSICSALDGAKAKIGDPLEEFCADNPGELECLVYDD